MARNRGRIGALAPVVLLLALASLCWEATAQQQPRVRKELRRLTKQEISLFAKGIRTMLNTPTEDGQALYGPSYKDFRYFQEKHAVAAADPRGDQGHGAPCFMTFHRSWLLEVELSLLAVVPQLKALPYWDITRDLRGGDISLYSRNYLFSKFWFGSLDGNPSQGYAVTDGIFKKQYVPSYSPPPGYESTASIYNGSEVTGLLRSADNGNPSPYVTRLPTQAAVDDYKDTPYYNLFFYTNARRNELPMKFKARDYWFCTNAGVISDWVDWSTCADLTTLFNSGASQDDVVNLCKTTTAPLLHVAPHWLVGGGSGDAIGDLADVQAAPNEFALFLTHHANVDRNNMIWQAGALQADPSAADNSWGFPASQADYPGGWEGCWLDDVVTSSFPFTDIFPGAEPSTPAGFTHADVLALTAPGEAPYTYDRMTAPRGATTGRKMQEDGGSAAAGLAKWPKFYTPGQKPNTQQQQKQRHRHGRPIVDALSRSIGNATGGSPSGRKALLRR